MSDPYEAVKEMKLCVLKMQQIDVVHSVMEGNKLEPVAGIILAGGRSRRFGTEDKCLARLNGRPLIEWVIVRARPQVAALGICANDGAVRFAFTKLPVIGDALPGFRGPLSAILAGLEWAVTARPDSRWLATFPADGPFCPLDLVARLLQGAGSGLSPVIAAVNKERHQAFGIWPVALMAPLRRFLVEEGRSKVLDFAEAHGARQVMFHTSGRKHPFFNINTQEDLAAAERLVASGVHWPD